MPKNVLIVEDNDAHRVMLVDIMESLGHETHEARLGQDVFRILSETHPDVILLDMQLPDMSGKDVTIRLKSDAVLRDIPVVAVSAFASSDDRTIMLNAGCCSFVAKPFDISELIHTVSQAMNISTSALRALEEAVA